MMIIAVKLIAVVIHPHSKLTLLMSEETDGPVACWAQLAEARHVPSKMEARAQQQQQ